MSLSINKNLFFIIMLVGGIIFGGASAARAQTEEIAVPMVGGYSTVETDSAEVLAAAKSAVKAQAKKQRTKIKLSGISKAERQVVAGSNYRLCLQIETTEKGKKTAVPQTIQTVVFLNLKQKYSLTSWAVAACTDAAPVAPTD